MCEHEELNALVWGRVFCSVRALVTDCLAMALLFPGCLSCSPVLSKTLLASFLASFGDNLFVAWDQISCIFISWLSVAKD